MFFYNIPILRHRDYRNVGSYMHEHKVNAFLFSSLRRIGTICSRQQQEEAISYLLRIYKPLHCRFDLVILTCTGASAIQWMP